MVYVSKPAVVAALMIAPAIAAPVSDFGGSEEQYTRDYEDSQFEARDPKLNLGALKSIGRGAGKALDRVGTIAAIASIFRPQPQGQQPREFVESELEAREPGRGWELGKKAFLAGSAAAAFGTMIAPIFKRPKNPTYKRSFEDDDIFERDFDEDLFERELEIDGDLFERYFDDEEFYGRDFDELEERAINAGSLLRIGKALGRGVKYVVPAAGFAGFGLGVAAKLRSRELDEGFEMYERDAGSALDELD